jgi:ACR3 family arsenite efflux pump ArsB
MNTQQHYVKVKEMPDGRWRVYWFTVESDGRSYGGRIIMVHSARCNAMEHAYSQAARSNTQVIVA